MLNLVRIPAGKFLMGSPDSDTNAKPIERPRHEVTISKPFYLGVTEVTQSQYEEVIGIMGTNPSKFKGATNPVETVSWVDAVAFCKELSKTTGKTVRLPTEAEWEYACRAGSETRFAFGNDDTILGDYAWYLKNSDSKTHPVGQKKPNAFGLFDMHGNVEEWCSDWRSEGYANAKNVGPRGGNSGGYRVLRGGSWGSYAPNCRSAHRFGRVPDYRGQHSDTFGFRVAVDLK
jgi:formylglycine-generating enzyme required for sulfatase activity